MFLLGFLLGAAIFATIGGGAAYLIWTQKAKLQTEYDKIASRL